MIYDGFSLCDCMVILPHYLGIPYVYELSGAPVAMPVTKLMPSFQPNWLIQFSDRMTFWQKFINLIAITVEVTGMF